MIEFDSRTIRTWGRLGSCGAFGLALVEAAALDESIVALTADLTVYSGLERFKNQFPDRLYNMGIAEQNMVDAAAGMAKEGFNPFASTYGTFATSRCLDQARVSMGYMRLPVKLVGLTTGFSSGILGATHMSCEDIAIMRTIPNITVLSPADTTETVKATLAAARANAPIYLRLSGIMGSPVVYKEDYDFQIGRAITLREGDDVLIVATGTMVAECLKAADALADGGIQCTVVDMHTIKPLDVSVLENATNYRLVITAEEHSVIGGLGSAVAESLSVRGCPVPLMRIGVEDFFPHAGPYPDLMVACGLTAPQVTMRIEEALEHA